MKKIFCDACGREIGKHCYHFNYLCHIEKNLYNRRPGYVDMNFNSVSGREETKDLCIECYNFIIAESYKKFEEIKKENKLLKFES